jgi:hypothetical protein
MPIEQPQNQSNSQVLAAISRLEESVNQLIQQGVSKIMGAINQSGANLQAGEAALEADVTKLGTALSSAISDLQAEVAADLTAAGVPQSVVDGVTAKLATLDTTVQGLTSTATAADPGPQPTTTAPSTTAPASTAPSSTPPASGSTPSGS